MRESYEDITVSLQRLTFKIHILATEQNCPEVVMNADHMNSPQVGGGGLVEYNETSHELRTENCFVFAVRRNGRI